MAERKTAAKATADKKEVVALVADKPAETKKRGRATTATKRGRKGADPGVIFMVETEQESGLYERRVNLPSTELMELMDNGRKVLAVRKWREF